MNRWKKKQGNVHYMNGSVTACNIPMLGNNYAVRDEEVTCGICKTFRNLSIIKSSKGKSVTDYNSALYRAGVLKLANFDNKELEEFLEFKPMVNLY